MQEWQEEKLLLHLTRKERDDKYDLNQSKAEPWMPNQDDRRAEQYVVINGIKSCRELEKLL